jgi:rhodanese-related sulfurtransferase
VIKTVNPKQATELLAQGDVAVIDVREPSEWLDGHLAGARLVPLASFRSNPAAVLASAAAVLFVCAAGVRSEAAARIAAASGASRVYNLSGGTRAWVRAGLPLENEPPALGKTG